MWLNSSTSADSHYFLRTPEVGRTLPSGPGAFNVLDNSVAVTQGTSFGLERFGGNLADIINALLL